VSRYLVLLFFSLKAVLAGGVLVQHSPFPADALTIPDASQITGKRVNLPLPDCTAQAALCAELELVNQLDGFNLRPRIAVTFSGPIDTSTLRAGIFLMALDHPRHDGATIAVNQVVWDPVTNTAYAKPDVVLDQHRRYLLVITDAVRDSMGDPVTADAAFATCIQSSESSGYCPDLARGLDAAHMANQVAAAALFTTMSVTRWLESARRQLECMPVVVRHPDGQYIFNIADISSLTANFDTGSNQFNTFSLPLADPAYSVLFGSLGRIAFASYLSPQVLNAQQTIDPSASGTEVALATPVNEIPFHVYLPNTPPPPNGYPVVIFGHGFADSSVGGPTVVSPELAQAGFATVAINAFGHGFGPQSNMVLNGKSGSTATFLLGGRGIDRDGDGVISPTEGCVVLTPQPIGLRDCLRQTVVDLMQLVRVIQAGVDLDGDGVPDLDSARIYYVGESFGGIYGTILTAVEPAVRAAALNVPGGSIADIVRWSPGFADTAAAVLTSQHPPLLPVGTPFTDSFPFPDQPVSINGPGTTDTQYYMELIEWVGNPGDPIGFAPHLSRSPLRGVAAKPVLFQMARGDQTIPNPTSTALIRAAGAASSTWMYRHDLAQVAFPGQLPQNPHLYLALFLGQSGGTVALPSLPALLVGLAAQNQIAGFLTSDGKVIPDMKDIFPGPFFEIPSTLPNDLGYSQ